MLSDADSIRKLILDEFVYSEEALSALESGEFRISRHDPTSARQLARTYRMRHGMAVARGKGEPKQLKAMDELATRLWNAEEAFCVLWILDTGDHEYIFFDIVDDQPGGILFFDRNKLPGLRYCQRCQIQYHGKPPEYKCRKCGQYSQPDTWKYRPC